MGSIDVKDWLDSIVIEHKKQCIVAGFLCVCISTLGYIPDWFFGIVSISRDNMLVCIVLEHTWIAILGAFAFIGLGIYGIRMDLKKHPLIKKDKIFLIKHSSLNHMQIDIKKEENTEYQEFDFYQVHSLMQNAKKEEIEEAINECKECIKRVQTALSNKQHLGYAGIAHTPLIFFLGFKIGDENIVKLFHKRRDNAEEKFRKLSNMEYAEQLKKSIVQSTDISGGRLILCISTTFEILRENIQCIVTSSDYVLSYQTVNLGYDVIYSSKQINDYVQKIHAEVHQICDEYHIAVIEICISSSVAFTFALAQTFSANHDPEIIVYNYVGQSEVKYPWGINITKEIPVLVEE